MSIDFAYIGVVASFALSAIGSALGVGIAGMASIGAWKKCYVQNKPAPFSLLVFASGPISQTFYGYLLMGKLLSVVSTANPGLLLGVGIFGGLGIGAAAYFQGLVGAAGADSYVETGKGFTNSLLVIGTLESISLFVYVFFLIFPYA
jgi:V/A-type H+-transporting ATPase subunit K